MGGGAKSPVPAGANAVRAESFVTVSRRRELRSVGVSDTPNTPEDPQDPAAESQDQAVENAVFAAEDQLNQADERAEVKRRIWIMRMLRREKRREKVAKDRSTMINSLVTIGTTTIVAGTAMYATLKTAADGRIEDRRGSRVDALVEHWSSTIADASTAIELLGQRSNDLWAYAVALNDQGVILDDALKNEATREKDYLSVRKNLASTTARAGLVSSTTTTECLDKFVGILDTWQNALNWTRSSLQVDGGVEGAVKAVGMQMDNRESLDGAIAVVRRLARSELAKAGEANLKCSLPSVDDVWKELVPSDETAAATEDTMPTEDTAPGSN